MGRATKLSSKTDANFTAAKIKRWSDYRKSWHQQMRNSKSSPEKSLSKSEQHLSQIVEVETPVPTTILELQRRNSKELYDEQSMIEALKQEELRQAQLRIAEQEAEKQRLLLIEQ